MVMTVQGEPLVARPMACHARAMKLLRSCALLGWLAACHSAAPAAPAAPVAPVAAEPAASDGWSEAAQRYVKLVLALGEHDPDFVDAYYGPKELREAVQKERPDLATIQRDAAALRGELSGLPATAAWAPSRRAFLEGQLGSLIARAEQVAGKRLSFDEESRVLYDAVSPSYDDAHFAEILRELEQALPGKGRLVDRYDAFRKAFEIPRDKLDAVFQAAIAACRERTLARVQLPANESFTVEYVTDKPWGGYNWYQGGFRSLIQVNTSLPIPIDRALDIACHEGYPGHHVYNVLLEQHLVNGQGFAEFTVYPLFSGQSLIAEGSANYGVELVFPGEARWQWEKAQLFPLAGLDASKAELYYRVGKLVQKLSFAGNVAAKRYLDGERTAAETVTWLEDHAMMTRERAEQRVRFMDKYRAYVINYNLGKELVEAYVEKGGAGEDERWRVFLDLLASPRLPSDLKL
jgi:hypothetical protein